MPILPTKTNRTNPPLWQQPAILSTDTALCGLAWLAFLDQIYFLFLGPAAFFVFFLLLQCGASLLRLLQAHRAGPGLRPGEPRWKYLWGERKMYYLLLPLALGCAAFLGVYELRPSHQFLLLSLLLFAIPAIIFSVRPLDPAPVFAPRAPIYASLFFFLLGSTLWPHARGDLYGLTLGLAILAILLILASLLEEQSTGPAHPFSLKALFPSLPGAVPFILLWTIFLSLTAHFMSFGTSDGLFFITLGTAAFNLFILAYVGSRWSPMTLRLLSRPMLALPTLPVLITAYF